MAQDNPNYIQNILWPMRETPNNLKKHLGGIWRRLASIREVSGCSGKHLGGIWEASGDTWDTPGSSPGPLGLQRAPRAKVS